jgi:MFS transporter, DHA2 family, multidrug resistance protein
MIVYRAIQGFIGGGMIPSVFAAAFTIFPPSKRSVVSPMIGLVATLAPTIGPTVGGYLSHAFSWHWLFLVNIIPGIIVTVLTFNLIDFDKPEFNLIKRFDWWGLASMAVFLGSLEYVLEEGNNKDWFNDEHIVLGTVAIVVGAVVFFWRAFKVPFPVVDLRAFANRNFAFGSVFSFVMGIGLYGLTYLYPLYLARIRGYDSLMIGETMFVSGLAMFCTAPIAGMMSSRLDPRVMMMIGFGGFALGTLPPERIRNASGLFNLTRNLGGAVGLAVINTILTQRSQEHYLRLSEHVQWGNPVAVEQMRNMASSFNAHGLDVATIAVKQMAGMVQQQAYILSFIDIFLLLTFLFGALVACAFAISKPQSGVGGGGGH